MSVLDNLKAANATGTARGTFPIIKNGANGKFKKLKLFGASTKAEGQIESVVLNSIAAYGKNLFGFEKNTIDKTEELRTLANQRLIFEKIDDNSIKCYFNNGTYSTGYVEIEGIDGTKEYSFSFSVEHNTLGFTPRIEKYTNRCTSKRLSIMIYAGNAATEVSSSEYLILSNIQVEAGTTATDFEPYKGNIANLPEAIEANGIGESIDCVDFDRGVVTTKAFKKVFNGSENWTQHDPAYPHLFKVSVQPLANGNNACMCSHFPYDEGDLKGGLDGCRFRLAINADVFYISSSKHSNASSFKAWLAEQYANGTPVSIVYEATDPIETPLILSPAALLELNKLRTFDSITCVSNDAGAEMEIEYFKNSKIGQEMSDIHAGVPRFILDGTTLNIIV